MVAVDASCRCQKKGDLGGEPGLMLAVTLQYLTSDSIFTDLQWGFTLAPNTISEVIREVCQAIVDAFWEEFIVTPSTEAQWHAVVDVFHH